jgi:hypothetical protein
VEAVINDPVAREASAANPLVAERRRIYADAASGLILDLGAAGYVVREEIGELRGVGDYRTAVPILLAWLPRVRYLLLADDIVRTLTVPFAKQQAFPVLLAMFQNPPSLEDPLRPATSEPPEAHLRATIGSALATLAGPGAADVFLRLVGVEEYGTARALIVAALPKTEDPRVPGVLLGLLDDPTVATFAVEALGKLRCQGARDRISDLLDSPDKNVRDQATKAFKRLG